MDDERHKLEDAAWRAIKGAMLNELTGVHHRIVDHGRTITEAVASCLMDNPKLQLLYIMTVKWRMDEKRVAAMRGRARKSPKEPVPPPRPN